MNCDHAFEVLTDRTAPSSGELAEHLAACPRCRQMAEVLEPALDLFRETPSAGDNGLPFAPPAFLSAEAVAVAEQAAAKLTARARRVKGSPSWREWKPLPWVAAACLLGAFFLSDRDRNQPAAGANRGVPGGEQSTACHRHRFAPEKNVGSKVAARRDDPRLVILACAGCHFAQPQPKAAPSAALSEAMFGRLALRSADRPGEHPSKPPTRQFA